MNAPRRTGRTHVANEPKPVLERLIQDYQLRYPHLPTMERNTGTRPRQPHTRPCTHAGSKGEK